MSVPLAVGIWDFEAMILSAAQHKRSAQRGLVAPATDLAMAPESGRSPAGQPLTRKRRFEIGRFYNA
jgi:hypothetical protein